MKSGLHPPSITHHSDYGFGDTVFLRLRQERLPGIVTGVTFRPGSHQYAVAWGDGKESWHYSIELDTEYCPDFGGGDR